MIHHVQVACPVGGEAAARAFYAGLLGWVELPKPPLLAARGGCWFAVPGGGEVHVGVEEDFRAALKAHPAFVVDVEALAGVLEAAGWPVSWADPAEIPGRARFHTVDGSGNRVEFLDG
ncbi:glyoxalase [Actinokineospora sp. G85]|uniref:glyoxalase n=1 Tax=Actinokineospora sp. G85 TaxID=3406626 RepID=UPI003C7810BA